MEYDIVPKVDYPELALRARFSQAHVSSSRATHETSSFVDPTA